MTAQRSSPGLDPAKGGAEVGCLTSIRSTTGRRAAWKRPLGLDLVNGGVAARSLSKVEAEEASRF
jgi:hypothetical protein